MVKNSEEMLNLLIDIGSELIGCNSEIRRVEDTIRRMGMAYGAVGMDVFVITSLIVVTMIMPDENRLTQSRRIESVPSFDFEKMQELNLLSRKYCGGKLTEAQVKEEFEDIKCDRKRNHKWQLFRNYLGCAMVGAVFPVFFGGSILDGFVGMFCGIIVGIIQSVCVRLAPNQMILQLLVAFFIGSIIRGLGLAVPILHTDRIMIGNIMLLIPGVAMTNALKDILTGDTLAGILRLVETIIWAGALAVGFMVSMSWVI